VVEAHIFSKAAAEKIVKAGGEAKVIEPLRHKFVRKD
jgi:ribosomal protein L18E